MVHAGGQAAHWDIQNKENLNFFLTRSLCFGCPSGQLALQHVPCDRQLQKAHPVALPVLYFYWSYIL